MNCATGSELQALRATRSSKVGGKQGGPDRLGGLALMADRMCQDGADAHAFVKRMEFVYVSYTPGGIGVSCLVGRHLGLRVDILSRECGMTKEDEGQGRASKERTELAIVWIKGVDVAMMSIGIRIQNTYLDTSRI